MKVEYSYHKDTPCMVVKGAEFLKALKDRDELFLLQVAVEGFSSRVGIPAHFTDEVNDAIAYWVDKTSSVIYSIQERWLGNHCADTWCEVYVQNGVRLIDVVFSDDYGRHYTLRGKEPDHE